MASAAKISQRWEDFKEVVRYLLLNCNESCVRGIDLVENTDNLQLIGVNIE